MGEGQITSGSCIVFTFTYIQMNLLEKFPCSLQNTFVNLARQNNQKFVSLQNTHLQAKSFQRNESDICEIIVDGFDPAPWAI